MPDAAAPGGDLRALVRLAIGRRQDHGIAVRIADPQLAVARVRIAVHVDDDWRRELSRARHRGIEVVDLEPEQDAVADGA